MTSGVRQDGNQAFDYWYETVKARVDNAIGRRNQAFDGKFGHQASELGSVEPIVFIEYLPILGLTGKPTWRQNP